MLVFPEAWTLLADRVKTDIPVLMKGGYSKRDQDVENPTFIVESVTPFVELRLHGPGRGLDRPASWASNLTPDVMQDVRAVVDAHATRQARRRRSKCSGMMAMARGRASVRVH